MDLVDGVAADLKQQLVNPLIQRMQLIREKLNNIVDAEEIKSLHEKRKETQDELDRIEELEDLEDLIVGALPFNFAWDDSSLRRPDARACLSVCVSDCL